MTLNPKPIRFAAPNSIDEAVAILAESNGIARVLAGGTDLLVQMHTGRLHPDHIVDIKKIPELSRITEENGGFRIGAAVSGAEVGEHQALVSAWPGVVEGLELIGSTQIQGRASLGGNLCNGSPAADSVPGLITAEATCNIVGPNGVREAKVEDIIIGPGKTSLQDGEFVVDFFLPSRPAHASDAYLRFIPRTEMDIAVVGVAVNLVLDKEGTITHARVSLGAVAPTPLLVDAAATAIIGTQLDSTALANLASAASAACQPIDDIRGTVEFRVKVAGVLAKRAAKIAHKRANAKRAGGSNV